MPRVATLRSARLPANVASQPCARRGCRLVQSTPTMETFQLLLYTPERTRSPLTSLSPTSRHRVTALCSAQLPARASRRSPALGAVAGSCTASQPYARRSCTNTMVVTSSYAGAAADSGIAPQPCADRGGRLTRRVAALCSARPLARASRRSLALGAAAYLYGDCNPLTDLLSLKAVRKIHRPWAQLGCLPRTTLLRNRISILAPVETGCDAPETSPMRTEPTLKTTQPAIAHRRLKARLESIDLPAPPRHSTRSPLTSLSPTSRHRVAALRSAQPPARAARRSPVLGAVAGSCIASQPYARRSCRLVHRIAAWCSAQLPAHAPWVQRGCRLIPRVAALCSARLLAHASRRSLVLSAAAGSFLASQP